MRAMARESYLTPGNLVLPLFLREGQRERTPIASMPGQARLSVDLAVELAREAFELGISAVDLFPALSDDGKNPRGSESTNPEGLMQRAIRALKRELPELLVCTDVALDPYSSDGHDGVVIDGRIDTTSRCRLAAMAFARRGRR